MKVYRVQNYLFISEPVTEIVITAVPPPACTKI